MTGAAPALRIAGDLRLGTQTLCRDLLLEVPGGGWTVLLGRSGVGKSTLGRLIAGLATPARLIGGIAASDDRPLAGRVAVMAQGDQLLPWANALSNATIGAQLRGKAPDRARARTLLARAGLNGLEHRRPAQLSGGQRQRVALVRTLIEDKPVVVLDEPFSALDAGTRAAMQDLAARMLAGRTVILITHDPLEAARLAHRAFLLGSEGARRLDLPDRSPPRPIDAAETLAAQGAFYGALLGRAAA
ncbi:putative hydroxymethylpyrimidine transport system ATP-binding protein [Rhodovulum bhavnagarense]|uniref:Putative hydroxymethylpyrimidine transport system ATP-binding protein n=1 Tax=Rhodovulum bhavnagarense TaxID=992286 RepID=A0A4R2RPD3_9RHOB|nr:ATP-binding cassette domain-containing protein [Rhodovulum bhavnagarense]TCP61691.1 putative hydroxymethylpyrimidine transport system ATP-binding protein [Rhodovulum bhavnagarense]